MEARGGAGVSLEYLGRVNVSIGVSSSPGGIFIDRYTYACALSEAGGLGHICESLLAPKGSN